MRTGAVTPLSFMLGASTLVVALLATLPFYTFNSRLGWLLSILVTEYGHWFALATLGLILLALRRAGIHRRLIPALLAGAVIFCLPAIRLFTRYAQWQRQLSAAFGPNPSLEAARPSAAGLFFGSLKADHVTPITVTISVDPELKMDQYIQTPSDRPAPWVMVIHGGGWDSGDSSQLPELNSYLAARGYGVFAINYRLAPEHPWPAARDDVRTAIAFIKTHAAQMNLDPDRWVILGRSAGGQLAQMIAYADHDPTLRGCISLYAPSDMNNAYAWGLEDDILKSRSLVRAYMGGPPEQLPAAYIEASALGFIDARSPPTLLLHGAQDPLVWNHHSELVLDKLREAKVASALITIPWGTHGFDYNLWGPGGQVTTLAVDRFLAKTLREPSAD